MALVVQDDLGTEIAANSYVDVAFADAYFLEVGNSTWAGLDNTAKEQNLVKAFRYLETAYEYVGCKLTSTQNTQFPRVAIYDSCGGLISGIPSAIKSAQCELAVIASTEDLFSKPVAPEDGYAVSSQTEKVAIIEESKTFKYGSPIIKKSFPVADFLLKCLVSSSGITLVRC